MNSIYFDTVKKISDHLYNRITLNFSFYILSFQEQKRNRNMLSDNIVISVDTQNVIS
jgi:hypothetical protein